jgi:hypothetical protein
MRISLWGWVALTVFLTSCSSGDGGGVEPENRAPTIKIDFQKIGVVISTPAQISVSVGDADGDPVAVTWPAPTRGTITPLNADSTLVRWDAPSSVGVDTIRAEVTDGTATTRASIAIKVGWPWTSTFAPSVFQKARSPYIITLTGTPARLVVDGVATFIEPGTELLLETAGAVIEVTDSLLGAGTPAEPIVIRPNLRALTCGDDRGWWEGIKVYTLLDEDGYLELDETEIWYAQRGVRLLNQGSAVLRNCEIRCSGEYGVRHEGDATLALEETRISDGRLDGVVVKALTLLPDSVYIGGCEIAFNGRTGLVMDLSDVSQTVPILVEYTNFEFNVEHAITLANAVFPVIHYNRFFGNGSQYGLRNIWIANGYPGGAPVTQLDAKCNYWGAAINNQAVIDQTIRDQLDAPGLVGTRVISSPWSNENPITGPSTCTP